MSERSFEIKKAWGFFFPTPLSFSGKVMFIIHFSSLLILFFGEASMASKPNRLIKESSPYLLQHAHNPVDWYPWGKEAFEKAEKEDKLIFLSVGYTSCHWCQVMEKEVFENVSIADFLNEHFVSIKVDREERPDIDRVYMYSVQMMTGNGGWPLNVFLTPGKVPVFGGSYFPPEEMGNMPGFKKILSSLYTLYSEHREILLSNSEKVFKSLKTLEKKKTGISLDERLLDTHYNELKLRFDDVYGGFGTAPKFPSPMHLRTLLVWDKKDSTHMVTKTLYAMAKGGILDQLGGGFHRYSIDRKWKIPHFEKMITDQALLVDIYLAAYRKTKDVFFLDIAENVLDYVLREMVSPDGGFYSSQDADIEAKEGVYYVWKNSELKKILGDGIDLKIFSLRFGIAPDGDFEEKDNILYINEEESEIAKKLKVSLELVSSSISKSIKKVLDEREKRHFLKTDTKLITSYNALMISSLSKAYMITRKEKYLKAARKSADLILLSGVKDEVLYRRISQKNNSLTGYLDDYSYTVEALLNLLEASGDWDYFYKALKLQEKMKTLFWDNDSGGFFYNPMDRTPPLIKSKFAYDESLPSPNAKALYNYKVLYEITGKLEYKKLINKSFDVHSEQINKSPSSCSSMMETLDLYWRGGTQIVILSLSPDTKDSVLKEIFSQYVPHLSVYLVSKEETHTKRWEKIIISAGKFDMGGKGTFYLCTEQRCYPPTTDINELLSFLK